MPGSSMGCGREFPRGERSWERRSVNSLQICLEGDTMQCEELMGRCAYKGANLTLYQIKSLRKKCISNTFIECYGCAARLINITHEFCCYCRIRPARKQSSVERSQIRITVHVTRVHLSVERREGAYRPSLIKLRRFISMHGEYLFFHLGFWTFCERSIMSVFERGEGVTHWDGLHYASSGRRDIY